MPYEIRKVPGGYMVRNRATGVVHSKHTTRAKAEAQKRLLDAVDHGLKPNRQKTK